MNPSWQNHYHSHPSFHQLAHRWSSGMQQRLPPHTNRGRLPKEPASPVVIVKLVGSRDTAQTPTRVIVAQTVFPTLSHKPTMPHHRLLAGGCQGLHSIAALTNSAATCGTIALP